MSKLETPLTRRYWQETGGTLVEEFLAVPGGPDRGKRLIDGIIIIGDPFERQTAEGVVLEGKHIVVIQTKAARLGMYLLGQAVFSARLMERFQPASIRSVAICTKGDSVLEPLAREYGIEVVVYSDVESKPGKRTRGGQTHTH
ncbi:MAG: hypothetical protein WHX52_09100 [Anaerolineae bacterium]